MKNLIPHLETQKNHLDTLTALLESELHLISTRDAESLTTVINEKSELLEQIAILDNTIEQVYKTLDNPLDNEIVKSLFAEIDHSLAQCKFRTEINQKAVEQGQLRLEHLRTLLLEARTKETMTYDKSGKPKGGTSGKGVSA